MREVYGREVAVRVVLFTMLGRTPFGLIFLSGLSAMLLTMSGLVDVPSSSCLKSSSLQAWYILSSEQG